MSRSIQGRAYRNRFKLQFAFIKQDLFFPEIQLRNSCIRLSKNCNQENKHASVLFFTAAEEMWDNNKLRETNPLTVLHNAAVKVEKFSKWNYELANCVIY